VQDRVEPALDRQPGADVGVDQAEPWLVHQVRDVRRVAGDEVVDRDHLGTTGEQLVAEVGTDETGPARDQDPMTFAVPLRHEVTVSAGIQPRAA